MSDNFSESKIDEKMNADEEDIIPSSGNIENLEDLLLSLSSDNMQNLTPHANTELQSELSKLDNKRKLEEFKDSIKQEVIVDMNKLRNIVDQQLQGIRSLFGIRNWDKCEIDDTCEKIDITTANVTFDNSSIHCQNLKQDGKPISSKTYNNVIHGFDRKLVNYIFRNQIINNIGIPKTIDTRLEILCTPSNVSDIKQVYIDEFIGVIYSIRQEQDIQFYKFIKNIYTNVLLETSPSTFYGRIIEHVTVDFILQKIYQYHIGTINNTNVSLNNQFISYVQSESNLKQLNFKKLTLHFITTELNTVYSTNTTDEIPFEETNNRCRIQWEITIHNGFSDINHLCSNIKINEFKCRRCCRGLGWYNCGENNKECWICPDSELYNQCPYAISHTESKCKNKEVRIYQNRAVDIKKGKDKKCNLCGIIVEDLKIEEPNMPAVSFCKILFDNFSDCMFWLRKISLGILNFIISLLIINLGDYLADHVGISDETLIEIFPEHETFLLYWNIAIILISLIFHLLFIWREMAVIQILIDNHDDKMVVYCVSNQINKIKMIDNRNINDSSNRDINDSQIIKFKTKFLDFYLILSLIIFIIVCCISLVFLSILGPNNNILVFVVLLTFKIKFVIDCISRAINLNMYRICSADKFKSDDIMSDTFHSRNYKHNSIQKGNNINERWISYYWQH